MEGELGLELAGVGVGSGVEGGGEEEEGGGGDGGEGFHCGYLVDGRVRLGGFFGSCEKAGC